MSDGQQEEAGRTSFAQQGIWLNERDRDMRDAYHAPCLITFDGELDTGALREACAATIARHDVLTSTFEERDGAPWIRPAGRSPDITTADLGDVPAGQAEQRLAERIRHHALLPFDLENGPLLRLVLFTLGPSRHLLLLVAHHLVFDGPSIDVFTRDLVACYQAALAEDEPGPPGVEHSFADYAAQEESRIAAVLPQAKRFWRERWREPEEMTLPGLTGEVGYVEPANTVRFTIGADRRAALDQACETLGVTRFALLLASMYGLLYRYGNEDPVITIALGLRPDDFGGNVGPFAQELPVTASIAPGMTLGRLAVAVHEHLRELSQYRTVPLNRAVTGVRPAAMRTAVSISYRRSVPAFRLPGLSVRAERLPNHSARGSLWTLVFDEDDGMHFIINHPAEKMSPAQAERIAGHWRGLLDRMAEAPDTRIDEVPVLSDAERRQLSAWSREPADGAADGTADDAGGDAADDKETLVDLFGAQAVARPDAIAARCGDTEITYAWLDAEADGLAQSIRCAGVPPGSVVAVPAVRSVATLTGLLAVLKSGNAYVLTDDPADLRDHVSAVLTETEPPGLTTVAPDSRGCACGRCETLAAPGPDDRAYVTLSADRSALVEFDHRALAGGLRAFGDILAVEPDDRFLALSPLMAPKAALELFLPLVAGARTVICGPEETGDGLPAAFDRYAVTHARATPATWEALLDAGFDGPGVTALSTDATLTPSLARRLRARVRRLFNAYGTGDVALWSTCTEVEADAETVTIGRPVAGAQVRLLDASGAPVPIGSAGELCLAGPGLARGRAGVRTGDRGRHREDGRIELLGADLPAEADESPAPPGTTATGDASAEDLETVARIWREVLRVGEVGVHDNLFDFGVNSLVVTQISARIHRRLGVDIPLEVFYEAPTVTEICGVIAQARREEAR